TAATASSLSLSLHDALPISKSLAPGYRVGWVAPGRYTREIAHHKLTFSLATSAPGQLGLAAYLEKGGYERHLRRLRKVLERQQRSEEHTSELQSRENLVCSL